MHFIKNRLNKILPNISCNNFIELGALSDNHCCLCESCICEVCGNRE